MNTEFRRLVEKEGVPVPVAFSLSERLREELEANFQFAAELFRGSQRQARPVMSDKEFARRLQQLDADVRRLCRVMDEDEAKRAHDLENRVRTQRLGLRPRPYTYKRPLPRDDSIEERLREKWGLTRRSRQ